MSNLFHSFARDEDGAVTVDWLLLVATVVALSVLVIPPILLSAGDLGTKVAAAIAALDFDW
ncbi:hypothetical protein [Antarcticimicrobium sediminis]|uniref:Pilus assembly protein n=1 Tax=Antarcticimicrobium sediminis TaxID=2546227 RepID=A0A4R5EXB5_9RHOB|nr:hypothetical protein [Antarcticimicrobium sediminis]TDE39689.1 hypothetical protein E1B25_06450 [Antarcticimicrobium sediminis]